MSAGIVHTVDALGWIVAAAMAALLVSQFAGRGDGRIVAIVHTLTPYVLLGAVPLGVIAACVGRTALAVTFGVVAAGFGALLLPLLRRTGSTPFTSTQAKAQLRVLHANVLYSNRRDPAAVARSILAVDADVVVLSEITARLRSALEAQGSADRYPHRIGADGHRGEGIVVWSRRPYVAISALHLGGRDLLSVTVELGGSCLRVVGVHAPTPTSRAHGDQWADALRAVGRHATSGDVPTVVVGDFNACRWNAPFRSILAAGLRDAHESVGRGLSTSWPVGRRIVPAFVRLDHALLDRSLELVALEDVTVPGSDHRALVVTVAAAGSRAT